MATLEYITENKTTTFKEGDYVVMHTCGEADFFPGRVWDCRTDSFKDKSGEDVVFLKDFTGSFLCKYLRKA